MQNESKVRAVDELENLALESPLTKEDQLFQETNTQTPLIQEESGGTLIFLNKWVVVILK